MVSKKNNDTFIRNISTAEDWAGKHQQAEEALLSIDGVQSAKIKYGTRGRPIDGIYVIADPNNKKKRKRIVDAVEVILKTLLNLTIDYRVVSIE